jgi:hypothetical protein
VSAGERWLEEDEEVIVHPHDPYHRIEVLRSSRHVLVKVNDELVAESSRPRILFETGLPPRYYLPREDIRLGVLERLEIKTGCAYKGIRPVLGRRQRRRPRAGCGLELSGAAARKRARPRPRLFFRNAPRSTSSSTASPSSPYRPPGRGLHG